jgi:hypothetical protein
MSFLFLSKEQRLGGFFLPTRKNDLNKAGDPHSQVNKIIYSQKEGCLSLLALGGCKKKNKQ